MTIFTTESYPAHIELDQAIQEDMKAYNAFYHDFINEHGDPSGSEEERAYVFEQTTDERALMFQTPVHLQIKIGEREI